jgi:hypothetical protein
LLHDLFAAGAQQLHLLAADHSSCHRYHAETMINRIQDDAQVHTAA